jgi:intracellular sulfur oxidation DsrE/DsrF family protein
MKSISRRSFVTKAAAGAASLGAIGVMPAASEAQLVYTTKDWTVSEFDKIAKDPARVKQVYDIVPIDDGRFLNNIKNSLNGLHFGFGVPDGQIKIVAALHGPANMLNYDDFIWDKYKIGAWLKVDDPATGQPAVKNVFYPSKAGAELHYTSDDPDSRDSIYQDFSIQALQHRGVKFLSCHTATEEQARVLIKHNNLSEQPEQIVKEMLAHTIPGVLVVASMVAAIALLQTEGHYSYITVN